MIEVTQDNMKEVVLALDEAAREDEMTEKTATNIWSVYTQMSADALNAKDPKLVCLKFNPCAGVRGPTKGIKKAKQDLFPEEFLQLMACKEIDIEERRRDAVATYTYMRLGELKALEADAVNVDRRVIHVHQAIGKDGEVKELKGRYARRIPIDLAILPVFRVLLERKPKGRLFDFDGSKAADRLRLNLKLAGVTREELFISSKTRKNITAHDLRATGITWAAMRGDDLPKIMQRAAHQSYETTKVYLREAENLRDADFGIPFPPLPPELWKPPQATTPPSAGSAGQGAASGDEGSNARSAGSHVETVERTEQPPTATPPTAGSAGQTATVSDAGSNSHSIGSPTETVGRSGRSPASTPSTAGSAGQASAVGDAGSCPDGIRSHAEAVCQSDQTKKGGESPDGDHHLCEPEALGDGHNAGDGKNGPANRPVNRPERTYLCETFERETGFEPAIYDDSLELATNLHDECSQTVRKGDSEPIDETNGETIPRVALNEVERLVGEARRVLQHRAWGNPLGPEKESALAALRRASELLGGRTPGMDEDEVKATVAPMGAAGLVLRKVARHERVAIDLLREFARSVHDLRVTELASEVLSAQSERIRLVLAVRLAEAVWAIAHSGEMSAWAETGADGKRRRRRRAENGGAS